MDTVNDLAQFLPIFGIAGGICAAGLFFGAFPGFAVNLLTRVYPPDHPRRSELLAELAEVPKSEYVTWVFGIATTVLRDGVPERWRFSLRRRRLQETPEKGTVGRIFLTYKRVGSKEEVRRIAELFEKQGRLVSIDDRSVTVRIAPDEIDNLDLIPLREVRLPRTRTWWTRLRGR